MVETKGQKISITVLKTRAYPGECVNRQLDKDGKCLLFPGCDCFPSLEGVPVRNVRRTPDGHTIVIQNNGMDVGIACYFGGGIQVDYGVL